MRYGARGDALARTFQCCLRRVKVLPSRTRARKSITARLNPSGGLHVDRVAGALRSPSASNVAAVATETLSDQTEERGKDLPPVRELIVSIGAPRRHHREH